MSVYEPLITSKQNAKIKSILREMRRPSSAGFVMVEGPKQIGEAKRAGLKPLSLWTVDSCEIQFQGPIFRVTEAVFRALAPSKNPQPPLALFQKPDLLDGQKDLPEKGNFQFA